MQNPKPTHVEFENQAPDTIEVQPVDVLDVQKLNIPDQAVQFRFIAEKDGGIPDFVSPVYYLGQEFGTADEMKAKYPEYAPNISIWVDEWSVKQVGKVEWDYIFEGERYVGYMLVPLTEDSVLMRKDTREVVWPLPNPPNPAAAAIGAPVSPTL